MTIKKPPVSVCSKNEDGHSRKKYNINLQFLVVVIIAVLGYMAGVCHYQIEATIGPLFGYKAHSGNIDLSSIQQTYNQLAANYDGKLDSKLLIEGANRGLVDAAGDPYTVYMTSSESTEYNNSLSGNIGGGIGAEIGLRNQKVTILRVLKDNPAVKAGLQANDTVLKINDQSVAGWSVEKAVNQIRGDEGTTVKVTIQRGEEIKDFVLTRAIIKNPSVEGSVVDGIGVMTITRFDSKTSKLANDVAAEFKKQDVKGVILDLRDNGGGYIEAAKGLSGLWLRDKVVVTERSDGTVKDTLRTGNNAALLGVPTIVLVNGNTASASEIVAGALQDYKVAKLVGEKTYGKGSVQQLVELDSGSLLKVTVARWYTPNGKNITKDGIKPDYAVTLTQDNVDTGTDPQLDKSKALFES